MKNSSQEAFLKDRKTHLANKLAATKKAASRETILPAQLAYKETTLIPQIQRALQRIECGSYGVCLDCHTPIARERLYKNPHAERCVPCQENYEKAGRRLI